MAERPVTRRRRGGQAVRTVLVGLVLVLAGCASIPTSGPVVPGDPVRAQDPPPYVGIVAAGPQPGADEVGVVNGFVSAMASYVPGYPTAREYLTPDTSASWQPSAGALVFDSDTGPVVTPTAPGEVRVGLDVVATLGPDGSYTEAPEGTRRELDLALQLVPVDGQAEWRIATPPEGVLISDFDFEREFASYDLYYFDPQFQVLVPDPVHLPVSGSLSTLLAEALLAGPSEWLGPAVRSAFPEGTTLDVRSVPVSGGTATVALSAEAGEATPAVRDQMAAQLSWTLRQVPEVQRVVATTEGLPLLPERATPGPVETYDRYDPAVLVRDSSVYVVSEGVVASSRGGTPRPVGGPLGAGGVVVPRSVAVDPARGARAVVVDEAGTTLFTGGLGAEDPVTTVLEGLDLAPPAWDRNGVVWSLDRGSGVISVVDPAVADAVPVPLTVPPGVAAPPVPEALSVALDGTRIALLAEGRVWLGLVLRDPDDPLRVTVGSLREVPLPAQALDVNWAAPSRLAVLLVAEDLDPTPYVVELSGAGAAPRGTVPDAVSIAAAPGQALVAATADGRLLRLDAVLRWVPLGLGQAPAYQG